MADEPVLQVDPSGDEGLFGRLDEEFGMLTQVPVVTASPKKYATPKPAKKRTYKRKLSSQSADLLSAGASTSDKADDFNLREAIVNLQQTVASLSSAVSLQGAAGVTHSTDVAQGEEDELSDGEIREPMPTSLVPERGEKYDLMTNVTPEKGDDFFSETAIDNMLSTESDALLTEMAALIEGDDKESPPLNEQLAKTINALARGKIQPDKLDEKLKKYRRPSNCANLCLTRVNPEIWALLKATTRARDVKFQKIQGAFVQATVAISMAADKLLEGRNEKAGRSIDYDQVIRMLIDAIAILGSGNTQLNLRRRDGIRPDLSSKFAPLCSSQVPCTSFLFGDDLVNSCKNIQETNRICSQMHGYERSNRRIPQGASYEPTPRRTGDYRTQRGAFGRQNSYKVQKAPYHRRGQGSSYRRGQYRSAFQVPFSTTRNLKKSEDDKGRPTQ